MNVTIFSPKSAISWATFIDSLERPDDSTRQGPGDYKPFQGASCMENTETQFNSP